MHSLTHATPSPPCPTTGEEFTIEMATHQAGDYYEGMIKGDK